MDENERIFTVSAMAVMRANCISENMQGEIERLEANGLDDGDKRFLLGYDAGYSECLEDLKLKDKKTAP